MADARAATTCDHCGQTDDHPKLHYGVDTYHFDCLPQRVLRDLTTVGTFDNGQYVEESDADLPAAAQAAADRVLAIREAAQGGTHGDDLVAHIQTLEEN